jgi:hypothetical protein
MLSPTGVIPEELMYPSMLGEVMTMLQGMTLTGSHKRELFQGWARTVGVKVSGSQLNAVYQTGWDLWQ